MNREHLLLVAVLVVVLLLGGPTIVDKIINGSRVGPRTSLRADGLVDEDPQELANVAELPLDSYALARALASEHGQDPDVYCEAVAWAIRNKAAERGVSVFRQLTDGAGTAGDGMFGEQKASAGTKYASTAVDPSDRHARIGSGVIAAEPYADITHGATHFFSPRTQDTLAERAAEGDERYAKYLGRDASSVDASWRAPGGLYPQGAAPVVPAGIDPDRLTLYRRLG
jgi:hypothetical protein